MDFMPVTYGCGTVNEKILLGDDGFYITVWSGPEDRRVIKITDQLRIIVLNDTDELQIFVDQVKLFRPNEERSVCRIQGDLFHCGMIEGCVILFLVHSEYNMMSVHCIRENIFKHTVFSMPPDLVADEKSNLWYDGKTIYCRVKQGYFPGTLAVSNKEFELLYDCFE